jgi:hypothetical protein
MKGDVKDALMLLLEECRRIAREETERETIRLETTIDCWLWKLIERLADERIGAATFEQLVPSGIGNVLWTVRDDLRLKPGED